MNRNLIYGLIGMHLIGAFFCLGEVARTGGAVGGALPPFASFWVILGSLGLIVISVGAGELVGAAGGVVMLLLAGIAAIFFTDIGTLGKLYSEALENIDDKQREGVRSVGAAPAAVQRFGVLPQVLPVFASQALYFWESNTRSATIIGAVGAGGIGLKLWEAMRTNQNWENVFYMVILILIVVFIFDNISNAIRSRLIEPGSKA